MDGKAKKKPLSMKRFFSHERQHDNDDKTGMTLTIFNQTSFIIGTSFIAIPFAFHEAGFGLGVILLICIAGLADYTVIQLVHAGELSKKYSYQEVGYAAFGLPGYIAVIVFQTLDCLTSLVVGNIVLGDNISKLLIRVTDAADIDELQSNFWGRREFLIASSLVLVAFPLSLYRNVGGLAKWAIIALISGFVIVIFFIIRMETLDLPSTPAAFEFANIDFVQALGIFTGIFVISPDAFLLRNNLRYPSEKRWSEVAHISVIFGTAVFAGVGMIGYITFTENVQGNLLENYCSTDDLINVGRGLYVAGTLIGYPIVVIVIRTSIEKWIFPNHQPSPLYRHFLLTLTIVAVGFAGSMTTSCLGIVLEIEGILIATPLSMLFPVLFVLKLERNPWMSWVNVPRYLVVLVVAFITIGGLVYSIHEFIIGELQCTQGKEPTFCLANSTII